MTKQTETSMQPAIQEEAHGFSPRLRLAKIRRTLAAFWQEETADEFLQKAAIIAATTVAVIALIAVMAMAASAINAASGWFQ